MSSVAGPAMSEKIVSTTTYLVVLFILLALTVLTVAVSFLPLAPIGHVVAGLSIAVLKASLVVLIFMHALHSPRLTWCVIVACIAWLLIMFSLTYADYLTRGSLPQMPGH
jgi:cytochrome c oxidase subunit IV